VKILFSRILRKLIFLSISLLIISSCSTLQITDYQWRWANPPTTSNNLYAVNVFDTLTIWAFGETGTMIKTFDFGKKWQIHYQDKITEDINSSYFFDDKKGIVVCSEGKIYKTDNQCLDWNEMSSPTSLTLNKVMFINNKIGFAVGDSGVILKSIDEGKSWIQLDSVTNINLNSICKTDNNNLFVIGESGIILKSSDEGITWSIKYYQEKINFADVSFYTNEHGIIIGPKGLKRYLLLDIK